MRHRVSHCRAAGLSCALVMSLMSLASAADVSIHLTVTQQTDLSATWTLEAQTSPGDNDGIAGYVIQMIGADLTGQNSCPLTSAGGFPLLGFTISDWGFPPGTAFAGMNSSVPSSIYYGVGSPDIGGRIAEPFVDPTLSHRQVPWPTPVLLAEGTASDLNSVNFGTEIGVNVWSAGQAAIAGTEAIAADVILTVTKVALPDCNANGVPDRHEAIGGGDFDVDGGTDLVDHSSFTDCMHGPALAPAPADANCMDTCLAAFDFDADVDVDLLDFAEFQVLFMAP